MHAGEVTALSDRPQPPRELLVGVLLKKPRLCAISGCPPDRLTERVPVLAVILDEIRRLRRQPAECVAEGRRRLARLDAAEFDRTVVDPLVRLVQRRRRAHVDRPRDPTRRTEAGAHSAHRRPPRLPGSSRPRGSGSTPPALWARQSELTPA